MSSLQLQDAEYIERVQCARWSVEEAISLSQGERPNPKKSVQELSERFLGTKPAIEFYNQLSLSSYKQVIERLPVTPEDWIYWMLRNGVPVAREWEAIYPRAPLEAMTSVLGEEPDYRGFVDYYVRDLPLSLRQLVIYALKCPPDSYEQCTSYHPVLVRTHASLPEEQRATRESEIGDVLTSPRKFIETYDSGLPPLDETCISWKMWVGKHCKLVAWLEDRLTLKIAKSSELDSRRFNFDQLLQDEANSLAAEFLQMNARKPTKRELADLLQLNHTELSVSTIQRRIRKKW